MGNLKRVSAYIMYLTDMVALLVAFVIAFRLRVFLPVGIPYGSSDIGPYTPLLLSTVISYVLSVLILPAADNFSSRRISHEFGAAGSVILFVMVANILVLYFTKTSEHYSRFFMAVYFVIAYFLDVLLRTVVKHRILPMYKKSRGAEKLLVVASSQYIGTILQRLDSTEDWRYQVTGAVVTDEDRTGEKICGVPVLSSAEEAFSRAGQLEIDSVLLDISDEKEQKRWLRQFGQVGKTVYVNVSQFYYSGGGRILDFLGGCAVVDYLPPMPVRGRKLVQKRAMDVLFSILCLPFLLLVMIIDAVMVLFTSRGPVFTALPRIGKNGRRFNEYRFRTMRMDAEERIREGKNPRFLFGRFLRMTHLDGLPQVWNIFIGDMSFVGPYAPTEEMFREFGEKLMLNMSTKPGITGLWNRKQHQADPYAEQFYIRNWSNPMDIRITIGTILRYFAFQSARPSMKVTDRQERRFIEEILRNREPMPYDHSAYTKERTPRYVAYLCVKRCFDIIVSLIAIIVLSPLLLVLMLLVILDDGGNPFYSHPRIGYHGKHIHVYKFRSMKRNTGDLASLLTPEQLEQYRTEFKIDNDPRITKIGNFLRRSSLDELPQLFNILGGSLSFVGPRPVVEKETQIYGRDVAKLLSVRPGLTGYWQAYARNRATYETGERQKMEMYYVDHQSIALDLKIIGRTFRSVAKQEGAQ